MTDVLEHENRESLDLLLSEWQAQARERPLRMLVGGKAGAGKSSLVNNLLGEKLCEEGFGADAVTKCVHKFETTLKGVRIQIFDTPGLEDISLDRSEKSIIAEMSAVVEDEASKELDLFIYSKSFLERVGEGDVRILKLLTECFGSKLWQHGIIVLTFANLVNLQQKRNYLDKVAQYEKRLKDVLKDKLKVNESIINEIPVHTAGYKDPVIPCEAEESSTSGAASDTEEATPNWKLRLLKGAIERADLRCVPALLDVTLGSSISIKRAVVAGTTAIVPAAAIGAGVGGGVGFAVPVGGPIIGSLAGAAIGAAVGGPPGAVTGAVLGGFSRVIQHKFHMWKMRRDKKYHYETQVSAMASSHEAPTPLQDDVIEEWRRQSVANGRSLRILIAGKVGVGKSALINNFLGEENLSPESFSPDSATRNVVIHEKQVHGVTIQVFDTPGLAAASDDRGAASIMAEMSARAELHASKRIDLFFYCKTIMERVTDDDLVILRALTRTFGDQIWKHGIIVLTMANMIHIRNQPGYSNAVEKYEARLKEALKNLDVRHTADIPVLTAGYEKCVIPCEADWEDNDWKKRLFIAAIRRADPETVPALFEVRFKESITEFMRGMLKGGFKKLPTVMTNISYKYQVWKEKHQRVNTLKVLQPLERETQL